MFRTVLLASCVAFAPLYAYAQQPAPEAPAAPAAPAPAAAAEGAADAASEAAQFAAMREAFEKSINHRTGQIDIAKGAVSLNVPAGYYYLDRADGRKVLEDAWGNPPDESIEGMIFKEGTSALDDKNWGVVITYDDTTGYVSDEDAAKINFDDLMRDMQGAQKEMNPELVKQNYPPITVVGWATKPHYDAAEHKVYWAKDLIFGSDAIHTLNYSARVLGRKGVLELNFVAGMDQLQAIEAAAPQVIAIPQFKEGFRYADFNPQTDKKADFGIAGLIAGGAAGGLLLAKKTGLIGIALVFLKKFGVILLAGAGTVIGAIARFFGGKKKPAVATAGAGTERSASSLDASLFPDPPAQPAASNPPNSGPAA